MSDTRITIEQKIAGEVWWIIAIASRTLSIPNWSDNRGNRWRAVQSRDNRSNIRVIDIWAEPEDRSLWTVLIEWDDIETSIRIDASADQEERWMTWLSEINMFASKALEQQRMLRKFTADDVIDEYYFLKQTGRKKTLKQLAEQYDFSENYLYQAKSVYDKRGKFGRNLRRAYKVSTEP